MVQHHRNIGPNTVQFYVLCKLCETFVEGPSGSTVNGTDSQSPLVHRRRRVCTSFAKSLVAGCPQVVVYVPVVGVWDRAVELDGACCLAGSRNEGCVCGFRRVDILARKKSFARLC